MILALLFAILVTNIAIFAGIRRHNKKLNDKLDQFGDLAYSFVKPEPDGLSPVARALDLFSDTVAQKIGLTIQASIRGSMGAQSRAITGALEGEALEANPVLGLLPKKLAKNPLASMGLQILLEKMSSAGAGQPGKMGILPGGNTDGSPKFNL